MSLRRFADLRHTLAAAAFCLVGPAVAYASPVTITFNGVPPVLLQATNASGVGSGFTLTANGTPESSVVAIDNGLTPPDPPITAGDYASQNCSAGYCATDFSNAAYSFLNGGFTLTRTGGGTFSASSFDGAIASNTFSDATRVLVTGSAGGTPVTSETFLLLPNGYDPANPSNYSGSVPNETPNSTPPASFPADTANGPAENFQTLTLDPSFTGIDALSFSYGGVLPTDPQFVSNGDFGFFPEFAVDNIHLDVSSQGIPEPASALLLLGAAAGVTAARRRRSN